jgi:hypothetical protein
MAKFTIVKVFPDAAKPSNAALTNGFVFAMSLKNPSLSGPSDGCGVVGRSSVGWVMMSVLSG